ncbi:hypothetical protein [Devosia sp. YR412]|uniref:hypothetical protein n=1 Tax=Devosia sp. YR412 TaxID=1881030 RepID=UPI00111348E4|nr:hypothetical protein [Devosia sp. YR412]
MIRTLLALLAIFIAQPAFANDQTALDRALDDALATFERALPKLSSEEFGVDVAAYRDALSLQQFRSSYWGGEIGLDIEMREGATGSCRQFAAFVRIPPENGAVKLVLCPQFFSPGADALRELTVLHEMVHVVAGRDECQAMAFAAKVQMAATGAFTPVDAYWKASGCAGSRYTLP